MPPSKCLGEPGVEIRRAPLSAYADEVIWKRFLRYALGSGLATMTSAVAFAVAYRGLDQGPRMATGAAFLAGATVNFAANRFWAWSRRARAGLARDALSYAALSLGAALAAAVVTSLTHAYLQDLDTDRRAVLVEGSYFATYAALFLVKFLVLDRVVFRSRHHVPSTTRA
jgi:putative flippase GtrA